MAEKQNSGYIQNADTSTLRNILNLVENRSYCLKLLI